MGGVIEGGAIFLPLTAPPALSLLPERSLWRVQPNRGTAERACVTARGLLQRSRSVAARFSGGGRENAP